MTIYNLRDFGAVPDNQTDIVPIWNNLKSLGLKGTFLLSGKGVYLVGSTLIMDRPDMELVGDGSGSLHDGGNGDSPPTILRWAGPSGQPMIKICTPRAPNSAVNARIGLRDMKLDGAGLASQCVLIDQVRLGWLTRLYLADATTDCMKTTCGVSGIDAAEAADVQNWEFNQVIFRVIDSPQVRNANGFHLSGSTNANTCFNIFRNCNGQHAASSAYLTENGDNNDFMQCRAYRIDNAGWTYDFYGSNPSHDTGAEATKLWGCSWQAMILRGTNDPRFTIPARNIMLFGKDFANGAPNPVLGTGASVIKVGF